jgi:DMSO/TMAO reductase YedYZ molybdopterin-dependent catalytic subunit
MPLLVEGEVYSPGTFRFDDLAALPEQVPDVSTFAPGKAGGGVRLRALLERVGVKPGAAWATLASADGTFAISVPLPELGEQALLAYRLGEGPLPEGKGGPVRLVIRAGASVDACAAVKGLGLIRLTRVREPDVGHERHG